MDPLSSGASRNTPTRSERQPRAWSSSTRAAFLLVGSLASLTIGYAATVTIFIVAVIVDAAPLGLSGEQQGTEPWVDPTAIGIGAVVFLVGIWFTVRTFRRHGARRVPRSSIGL